MRVAICTENQSIMINLVSMVAKNGYKFTKIKKYSLREIKGNDICIFDLDNMTNVLEKMKLDVDKMQEIILIGISRSDEVLDMFRPLMNVEKKPFLLDTFTQYKEMVVETIGSELIVNKDSQRIFDSSGINISELLDINCLNDYDRLSILKEKIINSKMPISSEDDFFEDIDITDTSFKEPVILNQKVVLETDVFKDNALLLYITKKLKSLNLSSIQIEQKINELTVAQNSLNKPKDRKPTTDDILNKIKNGYFKPKENKQVPKIPNQITQKPNIPMSKPNVPTEEIIVPKVEEPLTIPKIEKIPVKDTIKHDEPVKADIVIAEIPKIAEKEPDKKQEAILDVALSPEKSAILASKMEQIKKMRNTPTKPQVIDKIQEVKIEEKSEIIAEPEIVEISDPDKIPDRYLLQDDENQKLQKAIYNMSGGTNINKNNSDTKTVKLNGDKNLEHGFPSKSLLEIAREKAKSMKDKNPVEKVDSKAAKKNAMDKKTKPPQR